MFACTQIVRCQPDTCLAYVCKSKPLTAIRFGNGWYKTYTYEKALNPKIPRVPKEIVDSGTYTVGRWKIIFKSNMSSPYTKRMKVTDIYGKPLDKKSKWRTTKSNLYPTLNEFKFEEWKKGHYEQFMKENKEAVKKIAETWIRKYCPNYMVIIDSSFCGPGCYNKIVDGKNIYWDGDIKSIKFPNEINTIVHESVHMYNKSAFIADADTWKFQRTQRYLIEPGMDLTVNHGIYYQTSEFISIVPKEAPTKIFRFNTYVAASSSVSANVWGIYGLLDEFSAYYNGTKASWDGYLFAKRMGLKPEEYTFRYETLATYSAWYEFRTFIGWYIQFAKMKHLDAYEDMMKNEEIKKVFREIDSRFKTLIEEVINEGVGHKEEYISLLMEKLEPYLDEFKKELPNKEEIKKTKKSQKIK